MILAKQLVYRKRQTNNFVMAAMFYVSTSVREYWYHSSNTQPFEDIPISPAHTHLAKHVHCNSVGAYFAGYTHVPS
jgi:hypothetical protein